VRNVLQKIGIAAVMSACLVVAVAVASAIYHQLTPVTLNAQSTIDRAHESAKVEGDTRKELKEGFQDFGETVDRLRTHLDNGNEKAAVSDGERLATTAAGLSDLCNQWTKDLDRLDNDGHALFAEWEALIKTIKDDSNRVRESERFTKRKTQFHRHLNDAKAALTQVRNALGEFEDVQRVIESNKFDGRAGDVARAIALLGTSAREQTSTFKTATNAVLAALQKVEDIVLS